MESVRIEKKLEHGKHQIALKTDFNICDAFRIFDERECGYLGFTDFKNGLADIGVVEPHESIELFFKRYDRDGDGLIAFSEFADAFTPMEQYYASILGRRTSSHRRINPYRKDDIFEHNTAVEFKNMMRTHFQLETAAEVLRGSVNRNPMFNVDEAFNICDLNRNGRISHDELRLLLESRGLNISNTEAKHLFAKFDRNDNQLINFEEFVEEVRPKCLSKQMVL